MLRAHLAKANPQWKDIQSEEVLVTFQGPHDYISPSWYRDPGVPTWNYQAVHVYGRCRTFHDAETLHNVVIELTQRYEANFPQPWQPEYKEGMLRGITGLEIEITDIQCIYKLSQNRSEADRAQVIQQLEGLGSKSLFEAMKKGDDVRPLRQRPISALPHFVAALTTVTFNSTSLLSDDRYTPSS